MSKTILRKDIDKTLCKGLVKWGDKNKYYCVEFEGSWYCNISKRRALVSIAQRMGYQVI